MLDKTGREIKVGDVCFYSEQPHSNYADSLVEIYESHGEPMVGTLVLHGNGGCYISYGRDSGDLKLSDYGRDACGVMTSIAERLSVIDGLSPDQATVEYATKNYPID